MKDLLLYIARNLVDDPDAVTDMCKVIGRQGRIAKEIRTVVRSRAHREGFKVSVDIMD